MERMYTASALSKREDVSLSYQAILAACKRRDNRLPHVMSGNVRYIRLSVFEQWVEEEERRSLTA